MMKIAITFFLSISYLFAGSFNLSDLNYRIDPVDKKECIELSGNYEEQKLKKSILLKDDVEINNYGKAVVFYYNNGAYMYAKTKDDCEFFLDVFLHKKKYGIK